MKRLILALFLALTLWSTWTTLPAYAQGPTVTNTEPVEHALNVEATTNITTTFNMDIDSATVNTQTFTIRGEQSGIYEGVYSFPTADTLVFNPTDSFKAGEVVRVYASSQISSTGGLSATSYMWEFTVTTEDGTGTGEIWVEQTLNDSFNGAYGVYAADIDSDGDMDVLGAAYNANDVLWWENDGNENFTEHIITDTFKGAYDVYATDLDNDGDMDVLGAAYEDDDITWWENDGNENFTAHTINGNYNGANSVYAADVDGDGDMDVLATAVIADKIDWWENDGNQNFTKHNIDGINGLYSVYTADVDNDGDMDVLGTAYVAKDILWWENDGDQSFTKHIIKGNYDYAYDVYVKDVNADGYADILGAGYFADDITWWDNDGSQTFTEHTIIGNFDGAREVYAADINSDGFVDVLGAAWGDDTIAWWDNDGSQNFSQHIVDDSFNEVRDTYAADIDSDGDLDILGAADDANDLTIWYNVIPEIAVLGNNTEISNNDTTPATSDDTDFGAVTVGELLTHTFTISNSGANDSDYLMLIGSPVITLTNAAYFTVTQPASTTIQAGHTTIFALTFIPQNSGTFSDTITIVNNDTAENPYTFVISGTAIVPEIVLLGNDTEISNGDATPDSTDDTDFGSMLVGSSLTHTFTISNNGIADLTLNGSPTITLTNAAHFTVTQPTSTTLSSDQSTTFSLTFDPQSAGTFSDTVTLANNDTDENPYTFAISGTGYYVPDLAMTKTVTLLNNPATPGETITYTIVVANNGLGDADSVTVQDNLPTGVSGSPLDWTGLVTASESLTFTIVATVTAEAGYGTVVSNTASYSHTSGSGNDMVGFTVISDTIAPPDPTLITPADGSTITNTDSLTFSWSSVTDDESGLDYYTLQVDSSEDGLSIQASTDSITTTQTSYTPTNALANGVYTWAVKAHDKVGNFSTSLSATFTISVTAVSTGTTVYLPIVVMEN